MAKKLEGMVAVVTGGNSGIGLATAERFVAEGAHVFIVGRRQEELENAVARIGRNVTAIRADVSELADIDRLYRTIEDAGVRIDIVFANAAFFELATTVNVTPENYDKTFDTNARGVYFTVQMALPLLNDGGRVIVTGAIGKDRNSQNRGPYSASKAALRSFVRTWTAELKDRRIRVNMISPGPVETPIIDGLFKTKEELEQWKVQLGSSIPMGRIGRPEEVAAAALFLASDESSFVAGVDLLVDGGFAAF